MNVFYSTREDRLRAGWRLLLQTVLLVALTVAVMYALALFVAPSSVAAAWTAQAVGATASVYLAGRYLDRRPFADFGLHLDAAWWADFGFGAALGVVLMGGVFAVEAAAGWVTVTDTFATSWDVPFVVGLGGVLLFFAAVSFYEELLARGYHLVNIAEGLRGLGTRPAVLIAWAASSAVFGLAHAANPNATVVSTVGVGLAGLLLGLGFLRTGELAIPMGLHLTWNFAQGPLFGFPVSGNPPPVRVVEIAQGGPALWTGGPFGPEAGLVGIGAMLAGAAAIAVYTRRRPGVDWLGRRGGGPTPSSPPPSARAAA